MYDDDFDNDFGMSEDDLLYREMNPEDPWYMGPSPDDEPTPNRTCRTSGPVPPRVYTPRPYSPAIRPASRRIRKQSAHQKRVWRIVVLALVAAAILLSICLWILP